MVRKTLFDMGRKEGREKVLISNYLEAMFL